jgi:predicted PhzF superfamily epimerase YddE/YHI9
MPTTIPYTIVDAFATGPFTGNQAAVVVTNTALSSELMQKIAA